MIIMIINCLVWPLTNCSIWQQPREKKPKDPKKIVDKAWKCDWPNCQSSYTTKNMVYYSSELFILLIIDFC